MLKPMVARMASPNTELTEYQYALIGEAITNVWNDYGPATNPTRIKPICSATSPTRRAKRNRSPTSCDSRTGHSPRTGVYGTYFDGPATINLEGDMIGTELEELKSAPRPAPRGPARC